MNIFRQLRELPYDLGVDVLAPCRREELGHRGRVYVTEQLDAARARCLAAASNLARMAESTGDNRTLAEAQQCMAAVDAIDSLKVGTSAGGGR